MSGELLPNPLRKAPRGGHPATPTLTSVPTPRERAAEVLDGAVPHRSGSRVGPGRVRRSYYLPTAAAEAFNEAIDQLHYDSRGAISKADAAAGILRAGIAHLDEARRDLGV
jgi:hypothetical protein